MTIDTSIGQNDRIGTERFFDFFQRQSRVIRNEFSNVHVRFPPMIEVTLIIRLSGISAWDNTFNC